MSDNNESLAQILSEEKDTVRRIELTNVPVSPFRYYSGITGRFGPTMQWIGKSLLAVFLFFAKVLWLFLFPGGLAFLFIAPVIVAAILYFMKRTKVSLNEEGGENRYFFNIVETAEGFYIFRWRDEGIRGILLTILKGVEIIHLDDLAMRYFKEEGERK